MNKGYRILSIEAADIYKHEQEYGVTVGYKMPEYKSYAFFRLFRNILDYSLDTIELEKSIRAFAVKNFLSKINMRIAIHMPLSALNLITYISP